MKQIKFGGQVILMGILFLLWAGLISIFFPLILLGVKRIEWFCTRPLEIYVTSDLFPPFEKFN